jgi:Flp pilus assembly protein TadG
MKMQMNRMRRLRARRGFVMVFLVLSILAIVPAVGLGIDVSILYLVKAKLTAACDGASLAAARNLNLGVTMAQQAAGAQQRAQSYYQANYPTNYLGSTRNPATITVPIVAPGSALTVTTTGTADVQTFFMRLLGTARVHVSATGTASRKSLNMMMVLDRSSSMSTADGGKDSKGANLTRVDAMKAAALDFVDKFSALDTIGLIYFGSDSVLAFPPASDYQTHAPNNIKYYINQITAGDNTATTLGYWRAYQQLVNLHQPSAANVIVLFTDGIPNGVYAAFPTKALKDSRYNSDGSTTITSYNASPCAGLGTVTGVITQTSGFNSNGTTTGLFTPDGSPSSNHSAGHVNPVGCTSSTSSTYNRVREDVAYIPDTDANGNKFRNYGSDYLSYTTTDRGLSYGDFQSAVYPNNIRVDSPWVIGLASKNSLDHAAIRVRNRVLDATIGVTTYVIGFGGTAGEVPDDTLMMRIANVNDVSNAVFVNDPNTPEGMYIKANGGTIHAAFDRIASEVLRLSR